MKIYIKANKCRMCNSSNIKEILSFSNSAIDGIYNKNYKAPLTLVFCVECGQVQLREIISPVLYKDYNFVAENISVIKDWCKELSKIILSEYKKGSILEVGSGDGYFAHLLLPKLNVACVEPSEKLAKEARNKFKLKVICSYFDNTVRLPKKFELVVARHVMEHIENVNEFVKKTVDSVKDEGMIVIEVPDLRRILKTNNYANIFHEHINYFSPKTLSKLFEQYGFYPTKVMTNDVHGGAMCIFFKRNVGRKLIIKDNISEKTLNKFSKEFSNYKKEMASINKMIKKYKNVYGYGAANKTFKSLSLMGIKNNQINYIFDKNKNLHGQTIPQFGIEILSPEKLRDVSPDLIIIFAISYEKEIIRELKSKYSYKNKVLSLSGSPRIL